MVDFKNTFPEIIYLALFIPIGLIPEYGALDRIATQWFYLSVLNICGLIYIFYDKKNKLNLKESLKYKPLIFLFGFVVWGLISLTYSLNQTEVIVKFVRWVQLPISLFILTNIFKKNYSIYIKSIAIITSITLLIELYFTYSTFFQLTQFTAYDFQYAYLLRGATGNKNINSASLMIKIPFLIYLIYTLRNHLLKFFLTGILIFTSYLIFILSSRSAIISFFLVFGILIFRYIFISVKKKSLNKDLSIFLVLGGMLFAIVLFNFNYAENNSASFVKRASTINEEDKSTQQRLRFYKHSIDHVISNPIVGVGLGNWKIKSVEYDKNDVDGYTIPYHTHNDFLEITSELGLVGLFLYMLIFIFPLLDILKSINVKKFYGIDTIILLAGIIYFVDANLNFPHARPVMQAPFLIILVLSYLRNKIKPKYV